MQAAGASVVLVLVSGGKVGLPQIGDVGDSAKGAPLVLQ